MNKKLPLIMPDIGARTFEMVDMPMDMFENIEYLEVPIFSETESGLLDKDGNKLEDMVKMEFPQAAFISCDYKLKTFFLVDVEMLKKWLTMPELGLKKEFKKRIDEMTEE
jgi:hypothetical protein